MIFPIFWIFYVICIADFSFAAEGDDFCFIPTPTHGAVPSGDKPSRSVVINPDGCMGDQSDDDDMSNQSNDDVWGYNHDISLSTPLSPLSEQEVMEQVEYLATRNSNLFLGRFFANMNRFVRDVAQEALILSINVDDLDRGLAVRILEVQKDLRNLILRKLELSAEEMKRYSLAILLGLVGQGKPSKPLILDTPSAPKPPTPIQTPVLGRVHVEAVNFLDTKANDTCLYFCMQAQALFLALGRQFSMLEIESAGLKSPVDKRMHEVIKRIGEKFMPEVVRILNELSKSLADSFIEEVGALKRANLRLRP